MILRIGSILLEQTPQVGSAMVAESVMVRKTAIGVVRTGVVGGIPTDITDNLAPECRLIAQTIVTGITTIAMVPVTRILVRIKRHGSCKSPNASVHVISSWLIVCGGFRE